MTDNIRLYVGTDVYQRAAGAELALENSIRRNTPRTIDIVWMRQGSPNWDWGGADAGWATPFSMFRWFIPEFCHWEGRAIYMDADMVVLGDLGELWDWPVPDGKCGMFAGRHSRKADVILWHCDKVPHWDKADTTGRHAQVRNEGGASLRGCQLPPEWDSRDEVHPNTKILHWTRLATQPYKPYGHKYPYDIPHRSPEACAVFWEYLGMSAEEWAKSPDRIPAGEATVME